MASHTGVCPHIETFEIAHAGADAHGVTPIGTGVPAQPAPRRAVATFAGNPFVGMNGASDPTLRYGLERRMTYGAARAGLRLREAESFRDARGACRDQDRISLGVKIVTAPGEILAALWPGAAVAARRFAALRADKSGAAFANLARLFPEKARSARREDETNARSFQQHAGRLAPIFCGMRLQTCSRFAMDLEVSLQADNRNLIIEG